MSVLGQLNKRVNRLGFVDMKLLTGAAFLTGVVAAKLFPDVLMVDTRRRLKKTREGKR
jgi:hypothetical protein